MLVAGIFGRVHAPSTTEGGASRAHGAVRLPGADPGAPDRGDFLDPTGFLSAKASSAILPLFIMVSSIRPDPGMTSAGPFLDLGLAAEDVLRARSAEVEW